jgi:hypothetical protein
VCVCVCVCVSVCVTGLKLFLCYISQSQSVFRQFSLCHLFNCLLLPNTFSDFRNTWVLLCVDTDPRKKCHLLTDGTMRILLLVGMIWVTPSTRRTRLWPDGEQLSPTFNGELLPTIWVLIYFNLFKKILKLYTYLDHVVLCLLIIGYIGHK